MRKELRAVVRGRVQLVMYRDFAKRNAQRLNIAGTVCNRSDGTVEVIAQGDEIVLAIYLKQLHHGPILANVKQVDVIWKEPAETMSGFRILY